MGNFISHNTFFVDEKVAVIENSYTVLDEEGQKIGSIEEHVPGYRILLSLLINKSLMPMSLTIHDESGALVATIKRGWSFFLSKMTITDANDQVIGYIKQKFTLIKNNFTILNADEQQVAFIEGSWTAWDFNITDNNQKSIGSVTKKWNGALKEIFTTADKYVVNVDPSVSDENTRTMIVATSATIDMILKESK